MTQAANMIVTVASQARFDVSEMAIDEQISSLFQIELLALSRDPAIDFEAIVGQPASFVVHWGAEIIRRWHGCCNHIELLDSEPDGVSSYRLCIVPQLWLLSQRRNYRTFQHMTEPDIVLEVLGKGWGIEPDLRIDRTAYKTREYRVQYGESDFHFISRLLEDAGIAYWFEMAEGETRLVLDDAPHEAIPTASLRYVPKAGTSPSTGDYVTQVGLSRAIRPGRQTLRDHDFRRPPSVALQASAMAPEHRIEQELEQYHYVPGAFLAGTDAVSDTPTADDRGVTRADQELGSELARRRLLASRSGASECRFETTAHRLMPGVVMTMLDHPHPCLSADHGLLVLACRIEGRRDGEWIHRCRAQRTDAPFYPPLSTPKPRVNGIESATVVGPPGEEIHVDEHGRVRVQFHWDRLGHRDHQSSVWIPVSQSWAGSGYGHVAIPRVGQEVLVDFLGGDPDRPVIVGRVHTALQPPPYKLPEHKTQSGWRSSSSPGGGGYNEMMFEDALGQELVNIQAERDFTMLVKNDEEVVIGNNRAALIKNDAHETVGQTKTSTVGVDRRTTIGNEDRLEVGKRYAATIFPASHSPTSIVMIDRQITVDTGAGASIVLVGDEIILKAKRIRIEGEEEVSGKVTRGDLRLVGGPMVKVNC